MKNIEFTKRYEYACNSISAWKLVIPDEQQQQQQHFFSLQTQSQKTANSEYSDAVFVLGDQVSVSGFGFVEVIADDDEVELASDELKSRLSLPSIHYLGADFLPKRRITRQSDES